MEGNRARDASRLEPQVRLLLLFLTFTNQNYLQMCYKPIGVHIGLKGPERTVYTVVRALGMFFLKIFLFTFFIDV